MSDTHKLDIEDYNPTATSVPWLRDRRRFDESQIAQLRTRAADLEVRYLQAKDDIDSGRQAATEQAAFRGWVARVNQFDHRSAHALDPIHMIWEMAMEAKAILAPVDLVNEYEQIKDQIAQIGQRLRGSDQV